MVSENNYSAEQIWEMDKEHFIHPYTDFSTFKTEGSQVILDADGVYVTDSEGKKYIDAIAGLWCVNIGHGREEMADAIHAQILKMGYYNPFGHSTNAPASILSAKLAELAPGNINHVFYSCSGSVANDTAVRLVHYFFNMKGMPNKKKIISRVNGYHGSTYVAAALTGIHGTKIGLDTICDDLISHISAANLYDKPDDMSESDYCDFLVNEFENRVLQLGPENVAAFLAEPIMGAGGVLVAPENYHKRMYDICKKYDMLFIADEVVTAFGRLGHFFASEAVYGVIPDIINIAKGLSSAYVPLGATMISDEIYEEISRPQCKNGALTMGFTYSGHPVACAAALKNIEIMEREEICEHVQKIGPYFYDQCQTLADIDIVGDVRGSHLMIGIELVADKKTKKPIDADFGSANRVFNLCRDKGVIIRPIGNLIVLSPPLILNKQHCDEIVNSLRDSLIEVSSELQSFGAVA